MNKFMCSMSFTIQLKGNTERQHIEAPIVAAISLVTSLLFQMIADSSGPRITGKEDTSGTPSDNCVSRSMTGTLLRAYFKYSLAKYHTQAPRR